MTNKKEYFKKYQQEHKEELKLYRKKYYQKNKKKIKKYQQERREELKQYRENHKEYMKKWRAEQKDYQKKYHKLNLWYTSFMSAKQRCLNPKRKCYKNYGGRGIKFLMTSEDFKFLWFRDRAYLLEHPSIDRIDNDGNYELDNCRFIELSENVKRNNIGV